MAILVKCERGHVYIRAEIVVDPPDGIPLCPRCRDGWGFPKKERPPTLGVNVAEGITSQDRFGGNG